MIELKVEQDRLQLKGARDFYNDTVGVMDKHEVKKDRLQIAHVDGMEE